MRRTQYRQLRPGENPPPGEPKRYTSDKRGYVRLRWKIGPASYVETYEHRLTAGVPDGDVHHGNEDKGDNSPGNLHVLSHAAHMREHGARAAARSRRVTEWDGAKSQAAYDKQQRAIARQRQREEFLRRVAALYRSGLTVQQVAAEVGRDDSTVSRALRAAGVIPRRPGGGRRVVRGNEVPAESRQAVHARAMMRCERCPRNLVWGGGHLHHRQTRALRDHRPCNLLFLCSRCHEEVHATPAASRAKGWIVSRYGSPADQRVWYRDLGWRYLTAGLEVLTEEQWEARRVS